MRPDTQGPCHNLACPTARSLLAGILPGAALRLLLAIMPMVLRRMVSATRAPVSVGAQDAAVTTLFFIFQVGLGSEWSKLRLL